MKLLIAIYLVLGAVTATFLSEWHKQSGTDRLILAGAHVVLFALPAIPVWLRKRKDEVIRRNALILPAFAFGLYALGFGLTWYYNSHTGMHWDGP